MTLLRATLTATLALLALAGPARAGFINGSFESGSLTGWQTTGDALVVTAAFGVTPSAGGFQAFLTTATNNGDFNNFSGTDAVSAAALESFLGLSAGARFLTPVLSRLNAKAAGKPVTAKRFVFVVESNGVRPEQLAPSGITTTSR